MTLFEFLQHNPTCPVCNGTNKIISNKLKYNIKITDDQIIVFQKFYDKFSFKFSYYISYIINKDNSFHVEILNKENFNSLNSISTDTLNYISNSYVKRKPFLLDVKCSCLNYNYSHTPAYLNFKSKKLDNIDIWTETVSLRIKDKNVTFNTSKSMNRSWISLDISKAPINIDFYIPITSSQELEKKINNIILFS